MLLLFLLLPVLFIKGGLWLGPILLPWLNLISGITFIVCILVLLPLSIFRKTRSFAAIGLFTASYVFGVTLWVVSFLLSYIYWGILGLLVGLVFAGVGVLPVAMLASGLHGDWSIFIQLVISIFLTYGARAFGMFLAEKVDKYEIQQRVNFAPEDTQILPPSS